MRFHIGLCDEVREGVLVGFHDGVQDESDNGVGVPYWIMGVGLYGIVWVCMELCGMVWCGWDVSL